MTPKELTLPHCPDLERAVLGTVIVTESGELFAKLAENLAPPDFFTPSHRTIFEALAALHARGQSLNHLLLTAELKRSRKLKAVGGVAEIAALIDGIPHKSDLSSEIRLLKDAAHRRQLFKAAASWTHEAAAGQRSAADLAREIIETAGSLSKNGHTGTAPPLFNLVRMSSVKPQQVEWIWPGRIPRRAITIIEGIEGVGKSTLLCALAAAITNGRGLPETPASEPANVVWFSAEDDLPTVLSPRLLAAGADCDRVLAAGEPFTLDERGLLELRNAIAEQEPVLVVIDPIFAYTKGDANKGCDARLLTSELKKIADQFDCAIVLVRHVGKSKGLGDPRAAGLYSIEWRAAARSVLLVGCDPNSPAKCAITQTKNNLGPKAASLGYEIRSEDNSPSGARFYWLGVSDLTAEQILSSVREDDESSTETVNARADAEDFLRAVLADGPRLASDVQEEARKAGLSVATLRRAKDSLGVKSRQHGFGKEQKWYWVLPEAVTPDAHPDAHPDAQMLIYSEGEHLGKNHSNKSTCVNGLAPDAHLAINEHLGTSGEHLGEHLAEREEAEL